SRTCGLLLGSIRHLCQRHCGVGTASQGATEATRCGGYAMLCLTVSPVSRLKGTRCGRGLGLGAGLGAVLFVQLFMLMPGPAEARPRYWIRDRAAPTATAQPTRPVEGPLQIVISIGSQRLWVYDSKGLLETSTISTGVGGYPTPTGVFAVIDKE